MAGLTHTMTASSHSQSTLHPEKPKDSMENSGAENAVLEPVATDPLELPYRTLTENADMSEFTRETESGFVLHEVQSNKTGKIERYELVTFTPGDKENPKNWSKLFKWYCTMVVAFTCFAVAFNSAVITADITGPMKTFGVSEEVILLTITVRLATRYQWHFAVNNHTDPAQVFVIGFGVGPMMFAPFSEQFGRRPIYASTLLIALIFIIPCAVAQNIGTLIVCRAIDGLAFSAPMVLVGGSLADLWRTEERGIPMAAFSAAPFIGPAIGMHCTACLTM